MQLACNMDIFSRFNQLNLQLQGQGYYFTGQYWFKYGHTPLVMWLH